MFITPRYTLVHTLVHWKPLNFLYDQDPIEEDDISSSFTQKRSIDYQADHYFEICRTAFEITKKNFSQAQSSQQK